MDWQSHVDKHGAEIRCRLLAWYDRHARVLPWRGTKDPYRVWLSEMMLQQTRVETVVGYYARFLAAFPTVFDLAAASQQHVLKLWEGLGYYSRARNLHRAAKHIVTEYGGRFPATVEEWQTLPGVGRYSAGAITSIAFGQRVAALDGNGKRVLARLFGIRACVDDAPVTAVLWDAATKLLPESAPGEFNQALMDLGAGICLPRKAQCLICPLEGVCEASRLPDPTILPVRRRRAIPPAIREAVIVLVRHGRMLVVRREENALLGGLWAFPSGKIHGEETIERALVRVGRATLGIDLEPQTRLGEVHHGYTHFSLQAEVWRCRLMEGKPQPNGYAALRWVTSRQAEALPLSGVDRKILALL